MQNNRSAQPPSADPYRITALFDQYFERVYNYIRGRVDDDTTAEDLCAMTFERLVEKIHTYNPALGAFEPWLFAIARNLVNDFHRRQKLHAWLPWEWFQHRPAPGPSPEERAILGEEETDLLAALPRLNSRQRDLIAMRYSSGLSVQQIAVLTGLSENNVSVTLYRALASLRRLLSEQSSSGLLHPVRKEIQHDPK